jgi:hypothetical protein
LLGPLASGFAKEGIFYYTFIVGTPTSFGLFDPADLLAAEVR